MNRLKQLGLAMYNYASAHNGRFLPAVVIGPDGKTPHSWRVELLPYMEQQALFNEYKMDQPWDSPANRKVLEARPIMLAYPGSDQGPTDSAYFVLTGPETLFPKEGEAVGFNQILDGTSNTILIVEAKRAIPWTKPEDIPFDAMDKQRLPKLGGFQPESGGFNAGFADGSVRFLKETINCWAVTPTGTLPVGVSDNNGLQVLAPGTRYGVYQALSTRSGGEVISADQY
jgi:prepilin-type processing-associated H-X9-DG protein